MKKIICCLALLLVIVAGCKNKTHRIWLRAVKETQPADVAVSARDYSITKANAYNDLFLDSAALEKFIAGNAPDDSISENMRDFYDARNFEFAWFDSKGLTEQALGFRSLYKYSTDSVNKRLDKQLDDLLQHENTINPADSDIIKIELQLTRRFVQFSLDKYKEMGFTDQQLETFIPIRKQPILTLADSILSDHNKDNEKYAAITPAYNDLKQQLIKYIAIDQKGGWPAVPATTTKFLPGKIFPEIPAIKKRLSITGEFSTQDTTGLFTPELEDSLKTYQINHGISADGKITPALIQSLNVPVINRIQQLLINMERMRWMPVNTTGKLILVNIPEFMLHVSENNIHIMHMAVVVGKEGHNTTLFSGDLDEIVFSPYWNIPPSIVKKEILPAMRKNSHYLEKNHMEIVRTEGGLPEVRQLPGPHNSLGLVKFLFPNSFNIYLHDTPAKSLFGNDNRADSHGCIRISDPVKMANYLLEKSKEWTPEKIKAAMNSGVEKTVSLRHSVPVIITYYTAWVNEYHQLNFRNDVYGNDSVFAAKMFSNPVQ